MAPKQASPHPWQDACGRRAYKAWGAKHEWRMHVDTECVRLQAWPWFVEGDFGQSSMRTGPSVGCVPQFKACAEQKSATTRTWGSTGTGFGYLHARQFARCLTFCPRSQRLKMKSSHWTGLRKWQGVDEATSALLHNLPKSLRTLTFAHHFNQGLHHVRLPAGLQTVTVGENFNQSLDNVTWPAGLQSVTFGSGFNQRLDKVTWPACLQSLNFGSGFNQILNKMSWPAGLQSLTFGSGFNRRLDNVKWPAGLLSLDFWITFSTRGWTKWHGQQAF